MAHDQLDMLDPRARWQRLVEITLERLRMFEPEEGYILCDSGGKDSTVLLALAKMAGVRFEAHYSVTTVDPPELVRFIKSHHPETQFLRPRRSMYELAVKRGLPSRQARYCCKELKERRYPDRIVLTGIRWDESSKRSNRGMVEKCRQQPRQRFVHPIIDWLSDDVWGFIRNNSIPYCSLYDEGYKRLGCVLCPQSPSTMKKEAVRWPHIAAMYRRALAEHWKTWGDKERYASFGSEGEFWEYWINGSLMTKGDDSCDMFSSGMGDDEAEPGGGEGK